MGVPTGYYLMLVIIIFITTLRALPGQENCLAHESFLSGSNLVLCNSLITYRADHGGGKSMCKLWMGGVLTYLNKIEYTARAILFSLPWYFPLPSFIECLFILYNIYIFTYFSLPGFQEKDIDSTWVNQYLLLAGSQYTYTYASPSPHALKEIKKQITD